jgi:hypothetical protein
MIEQKPISIYRNPILVVYHFALYVAEEAVIALRFALSHTRLVGAVLSLMTIFTLLYFIENPLQSVSKRPTYYWKTLMLI